MPALERHFPPLEGSAFPVPQLGWSSAQLFAVCLGSTSFGGSKGPSAISQHSHAGFALTCFGLTACVPHRYHL